LFMSSLDTYDFSSSYVTFVTPKKENTARIQVEASCKILDGKGLSEEYFLFASCKSETVYVPEGLFKTPNYDFCGIFSEREYLILRTHASHEPDRKDPAKEYQVGLVKDNFREVRTDPKKTLHTRVLNANAEIIEATLKNRKLNGRTEFANAEKGLRAILEYPIKTININEETNVFQVDTGPVPLPDLESKETMKIGWFRLAYVAFNNFDRAEFVIQQPTPIGRGIYVNHYSKIQGLRTNNSIIVLSDSH